MCCLDINLIWQSFLCRFIVLFYLSCVILFTCRSPTARLMVSGMQYITQRYPWFSRVMTVNYRSCFCIMNCVILSIKSPALWPTQQHSCAYCLRLSHACGITSASFDWQLHNSYVVANGGCVTFSLLSRFARCTYNCRCQRTRTSQAPSPPRARCRESSWLQVNENTSGMCGTVMFGRCWVCWHVCKKFKHRLLRQAGH